MKTITTIILSIFLISCISAIDITAGESYNLTLSEPYFDYKVTGNQTEVDLNITQDGTDVTIVFGKYINDTFTITFYNWKEEVIQQSQQSGGGSSYTKTVVINETINETEEEIPDENGFFPIEDDGAIVIIPEIPEEKNNWKLIGWIIIGILTLGGALYLWLWR